MKHLLLISAPLLVVASVFGCSTFKTSDQREIDRANVKRELKDEMSLKADRERLDKLRKDIPAETRKENDELALYMELMNKGTENPTVVREKFHGLVQKRRTSFRNKVAKLRADFRTDETKRREEMMKDQRARRERFVKGKPDMKEQREFFGGLDDERKRFFADEKDRRQSFESELNVQSKDFDSYMRERQKEFDEQYRLYSKKFSEKPKDKAPATGDSSEEFQKLRDAEATPLGTEE